MSAERPHCSLRCAGALGVLLLSAASAHGQDRAREKPAPTAGNKPASAPKPSPEPARPVSPASVTPKPSGAPSAPAARTQTPAATHASDGGAPPDDTAVLQDLEFLMIMEMLRDYELLDDAD